MQVSNEELSKRTNMETIRKKVKFSLIFIYQQQKFVS